MRLLLIAFYFPPAGGGGVQRPLKLAGHLASFGIETHVLAPVDPKWIHRDQELELPAGVVVHRVPYRGARGRLPAEELYGLAGLARLRRRAALTPRRFLVPDENVGWFPAAALAARQIVRRAGIDVALTTSPPTSVHLVGAAVKASTRAAWVADLRDSLVAKPDLRIESAAVRAKERTHRSVARLVGRSADAIVAVTETIAEEMRALGPRGDVVVIGNGADFEDFDGLEYRANERFRITHTGSFFGKRDPRPFLEALRRSPEDVVARFVGDFRQRDAEWAASLGLGDRLELTPFVPHREAIRLQRSSEALLLLLPEEAGRGLDVPSGKLFEYLAAGRPIIAAVPTGGTAAKMVEQAKAGVVVDPDDVEGLVAGIQRLHAAWRARCLGNVELDAAFKATIDRRTRSRQFADLLERLARDASPR